MMAKPGPKPGAPNAGRPKKHIDQQDFEKLCSIHATKEEMLGWFDVGETTLEDWVKMTYSANFSEVLKRKSAHGKISLRRQQLQLAMKGNPTMLIWMGKQLLGQRDYKSIELQADVTTTNVENDSQKARERLERIKKMMEEK